MPTRSLATPPTQAARDSAMLATSAYEQACIHSVRLTNDAGTDRRVQRRHHGPHLGIVGLYRYRRRRGPLVLREHQSLTSHLRAGMSVGLSPRGEVDSVNNEQHEQDNRYNNH
jgi:hypothetical protein